jgi:hypothetical protein
MAPRALLTTMPFQACRLRCHRQGPTEATNVESAARCRRRRGYGRRSGALGRPVLLAQGRRPRKVDAIAVLGGAGARLTKGLELDGDGYAQTLLISTPEHSAVRQGIQRGSVICFLSSPETTQGEVRCEIALVGSDQVAPTLVSDSEYGGSDTMCDFWWRGGRPSSACGSAFGPAELPVRLDPRSAVRWAQRVVGPLAASGRIRGARVGNQSFAAIRPHGDRAPWRSAAAEAGLATVRTTPLPLGQSGIRSVVRPNVLVRLQRCGPADG